MDTSFEDHELIRKICNFLTRPAKTLLSASCNSSKTKNTLICNKKQSFSTTTEANVYRLPYLRKYNKSALGKINCAPGQAALQIPANCALSSIGISLSQDKHFFKVYLKKS